MGRHHQGSAKKIKQIHFLGRQSSQSLSQPALVLRTANQDNASERTFNSLQHEREPEAFLREEYLCQDKLYRLHANDSALSIDFQDAL